jgi:chain length determinant protein (polysaccharide antigen chain regulator)
LQYDTPNKDTAVAIVQQYLHFAEQGLIDVLTQQITQYISHSTKALELEIQFEREAAKQARMDKIAQLESDLAIAKKLGIVDNLYFNLAGKLTGNKSGVFNIFTNNTSTPTYLRGTKVITAELESLKNRESDDPYIPSLRQKQDQLLKLSKVQFTPGAFHSYQLDGEITKPKHPMKPKKTLVLVLGVVLGLFLGIFAAFIAEFIAKAREQELSES